MKRLAPLLLTVLAGTAQAGFENMMNPMFNPGNSGLMGSPWGQPNPFGQMNPLAQFNPLGGVNPLLLGVPLVGLGGMGMLGWGGMYPALQMAPNMMSYSHLNQVANPYLGGPFSGNPYLRQSMPIPFLPPAFSPSVPTLPFSQPQGMSPFSPPPGLMQFVMPQQAAPRPVPGFFPAMPGAAPQASFIPMFQPAPQPAPHLAPQAPQADNPYLPASSSATPGPVSSPAASLSAPSAPPPPEKAPALAPLDPAAFMQMYMQPVPPAAK